MGQSLTEAREYFETVRSECRKMEELQFQMAECADGIRAASYEAGAASAVGNPTERRALSDLERSSRLEAGMQELADDVAEALALISGVGQIMGERYAKVLEARYIDGMTWDDVALAADVSRRTAMRCRDTACDLIDALGRAHILQGMGFAEN
jgi:hypothetical protein